MGDETWKGPYCNHVKIAHKQSRVKYDMALTAFTIIFRNSVAQEALQGLIGKQRATLLHHEMLNTPLKNRRRWYVRVKIDQQGWIYQDCREICGNQSGNPVRH